MVESLGGFCIFSESNREFQGGSEKVVQVNTDVTVWSMFLCSALTHLPTKMC